MNRSSALSEILLDHLRMINPHSWPGMDGLTLDVVLQSYSQAAASGQVPGKNELLRRHPELSAELEAVFAQPESARSRSSKRFNSPLYFERTD
jgi:hypothetical protein